MKREHQQNKSKPNVLEKAKINNDKNDNNRTLLVGLSFSGKTYLIFYFFSRILIREVYIFSKSPHAQ